MKKSSANEVLTFLRKNGSITSKQAYDLFGVQRLSGIIYVLREKGFEIETKRVTGKNRYGNTSNYAVYQLLKDMGEVVEIDY